MAIGMLVDSTVATMAAAVPSPSVSNPMMKPAMANRPAA